VTALHEGVALVERDPRGVQGPGPHRAPREHQGGAGHRPARRAGPALHGAGRPGPGPLIIGIMLPWERRDSVTAAPRAAPGLGLEDGAGRRVTLAAARMPRRRDRRETDDDPYESRNTHNLVRGPRNPTPRMCRVLGQTEARRPLALVLVLGAGRMNGGAAWFPRRVARPRCARATLQSRRPRHHIERRARPETP